MRETNGRVVGETERENKGIDILIEGHIVGLERNSELGKHPITHKHNPKQ